MSVCLSVIIVPECQTDARKFDVTLSWYAVVTVMDRWITFVQSELYIGLYRIVISILIVADSLYCAAAASASSR